MAHVSSYVFPAALFVDPGPLARRVLGGAKSGRSQAPPLAPTMRRPDLSSQLRSLPARPGVYQFFDAAEHLLYVGKAKNLRSRVRTYFHDSAVHPPKTARLVSRIARLDWIVTESELEAMLLEMNLIKAHRPRFNVVLRDDKRYPYIKIRTADPFPKVEATRRIVADGSRYFGPYTSAGALYETLDTLRKVFPYLTCTRTITGRDPRACLYHDIGLCAAPCIGASSEAEYRHVIDRLVEFLDGKYQPVMADLRRRMAEHSVALEYEQAARVRDRILAMERVVERQRIFSPGTADQDVIAVAEDAGQTVVQVFFVREGNLIGREHFRLDGADEEAPGEVLAGFIKQFYAEAGQIPGELIVPASPLDSDVIQAWLSDRRGARVRITVPQRGHKRDLVNVAAENAADTLRALKAWTASEAGQDALAIEELVMALDLPRPPRRIECFDISNLMGTGTVGSMVVFEDGAPDRDAYRRFKVRTAAPGDDFGAMSEVIERRFRRLEEFRRDGDREDRSAAAGPAAAARDAFATTPDLVVIDGGKGQLGAALAVMRTLGLDDVPLVSLAKRREELYRPGRSDAIRLPQDSPGLLLVRRIRDEAHRFAVTYHRSLRRKSGLASSLDEIPGIGAARRRALLQAFGSLDGIRAATVDELAALPGMTRAAAEKVKAHL